MKYISFTILVVLYKLRPKESKTLLSLAKCKEEMHDSYIILRDNSPVEYNKVERESLDDILTGLNYRYIFNGKNESLSRIYNETISGLKSEQYLVIFDHDSAFDAGFLKAARAAILEHPQYSLYLPLVYCEKKHVSPLHLHLFKGSFWSKERIGEIPSRHQSAINSGMVIAGHYLKGDFPGYDERFRFYGTDNDFMWQYESLRDSFYVFPYRMHHSLDFYAKGEESFESKARRFREIRKALLLGMRRKRWWAYILCYIYFDIYSIKFSLLHRDRRFMFLR